MSDAAAKFYFSLIQSSDFATHILSGREHSTDTTCGGTGRSSDFRRLILLRRRAWGHQTRHWGTTNQKHTQCTSTRVRAEYEVLSCRPVPCGPTHLILESKYRQVTIHTDKPRMDLQQPMSSEHTASGHAWPGLGAFTRSFDDAFSPRPRGDFITPDFNFHLHMSSNMPKPHGKGCGLINLSAKYVHEFLRYYTKRSAPGRIALFRPRFG